MAYSDELLSEINGVNDYMLDAIREEYADSIVITGTERGSESVAEEKFYHNSNLALSCKHPLK